MKEAVVFYFQSEADPTSHLTSFCNCSSLLDSTVFHCFVLMIQREEFHVHSVCGCVSVRVILFDLSPYGVGLSRGTGGELLTWYWSELLARRNTTNMTTHPCIVLFVGTCYQEVNTKHLQ